MSDTPAPHPSIGFLAPGSLARVRTVLGIDLRTLALFRVLLGAYLLADLALRARDLSAHYSDFGVMPREVAVSLLHPASWSLHLINGSALFQGGLFALAGVFALMLLLGWRTRAATVASWVLLLSLQNRNVMVLSGEDNLALLLLFWAMFLPLGARYSVDAALSRDRAPPGHGFASVATAALLIQGMSMYLFSALLKSDPIWVPEGTAVYYALELDYMATSVALWLRQFPALLEGLTFYVWGLELIGPILIFSPIAHKPLRAALLVAFITMHLGFWACLEIGLFPLISIIMNLTFMPGWMWDEIEDLLGLGRPRDLTLWYDRDCLFCENMCRLIRMFLFLGHSPIRPAQEDPRVGSLLEATNSWVVTDPSGEALQWDALRRLVAASPLLFPLAGPMGWAPVVRAGTAAYGWIARNRSWIAAISAAAFPRRPPRLHPTRLGSTLAACALVFVTVQNVSTLPGSGLQLPGTFRALRQALGLYQNWTMFAPHPELASPRPLVLGELADGTIVDVYGGQIGAPNAARPALVSATYRNYRWRKFLSLLEDESYGPGAKPLALGYGRYLCRVWNTGTAPDRMLMTFTIQFHLERTNPPGVPDDSWVSTVWFHDCFG